MIFDFIKQPSDSSENLLISIMKTVHIKVDSKEAPSKSISEDSKVARKTLKVLQQAVDDKENLAGRPTLKESDKPKRETIKKIKLMHKAVQTEEYKVTEEDLTSDEPSEDYWRRLAEKRGDALNESLQENERLKENVDALKEENRICKEMLEESKHLVEVLKEMLEENEDETETNE